MANLFFRFVLAALLLAATEVAFAGETPKFNIAEGANQVSIGNEYIEHAKKEGNDGDRNYAQLEVFVPNVKLTLFNETYSVGGYGVCIRVQLVDDEYFPKTNEKGEEIHVRGGWNSEDSDIKIRKSDYAEIKRNGSSATFKTKEDLGKTLQHEAIHAAFSQEYPYLKSDNPGLYSFVTEMLAYVGASGFDEHKAATHIAEKYPRAKAFADKYLAEFDKKQCEKQAKVLLPDNPVSAKYLKDESHSRESDEIVRSKMNKEKDTLKKDGARGDVQNEKKVDDVVDKVGIKGWCKCGNKKRETYCCGQMAVLVGMFGGAGEKGARGEYLESIVPYVYMLCGDCGKCIRSDDFFDVGVERMLQMTNDLTVRQVEDMRKKAQEKLFSIPDGQIVIPGKCMGVEHKVDMAKVGTVDNNEFTVCLACGRVCESAQKTDSIGSAARKGMEPKVRK